MNSIQHNKSRSANQRATQRGAALVTTLLIVALITVTVTAMTTKQHRAIQLAQNRQTQLQLKNLASAGEKFAMAVLRRDKKEAERGDSDSTDDYWAQSLPPVPVDGATIEGCVIDLQGKFNLNNLVDAEGVPDEEEFRILEGLLTALTIDVTKAEAIRDWIDSDIDVKGGNGAEDDFYTGQSPAYRAANGPMASPTELLLVSGFRVIDEGGLDDYDTLSPHIATIPTGSAINVNTASEAVLAALAPHMVPLAGALKVVDDDYWEEFPGCPPSDLLEEEAEQDPDAALAATVVTYEDIETFRGNARGPLPEDNLDSANIDIKSNYYLSRVTVKRDDMTYTQYTTFYREPNGALETISRSRGSL